MPRSIRGRAIVPTRSWTRSTKYLIICSVTSKSLMTPSRSGRMAMMLAGVRPTIRLASAPDGQDPPGLGVDRHDRRLADHDPAIAHVDQGVGGPEVDPDVAGEEAEQTVEHGAWRVLRAGGSSRRGRRRSRARRGRTSGRAGKPGQYTRSSRVTPANGSGDRVRADGTMRADDRGERINRLVDPVLDEATIAEEETALGARIEVHRRQRANPDVACFRGGHDGNVIGRRVQVEQQVHAGSGAPDVQPGHRPGEGANQAVPPSLVQRGGPARRGARTRR